MRLMIFVTSLLIQCLSLVSAATISSEKESDIRKLFEVMDLRGAMKTQLELAAATSFPVVIEEAKRRKPNLTDQEKKAIGRILVEVYGSLVERLIDASVIAYDESYSHSEIKEIYSFYRSPVGKKSIAIGKELQTKMILQTGLLYSRYAQPEIEKKVGQILLDNAQANIQPIPTLTISDVGFWWGDGGLALGFGATPASIKTVVFKVENQSQHDLLDMKFKVAFLYPNGNLIDELCGLQTGQKPLLRKGKGNGNSNEFVVIDVARCGYQRPQNLYLSHLKNERDQLTKVEEFISKGTVDTLKILPYLVSATTSNGEQMTCDKTRCEIRK